MAKTNAPFVVFNGGEIGKETLSRVTLENYAACSETLENIWVDANGPMGLRPGFAFKADIGTGKSRIHPFVRSVRERFLLVLSNAALRIASAGDIIARPPVTSVVANGSFDSGSLDYVIGATLTASSTTTTTIVSYSATGGTGGGGFGGGAYDGGVSTTPASALSYISDNDPSTAWTSAPSVANSWITFDMGTAKVVKRLWLTAASTFGAYAPTSWVFQASATGAFAGEQVALLSVGPTSPYANSERRQFSIPNVTAYRYYRLYMTANGNDGTLGATFTDVGGVSTYTPGPSGYWRLGTVEMPELEGWTDISQSGAGIGNNAGNLLLNSNGSATAGVRQQVATSNAGTLHALEIRVHHGPVKFKCGSTAGGSDYIEERSLRTGHHSLAFTPSGSFWIELTSSLYRQVEVGSITVAAAGDMVIDTPWAVGDLQSLRFHQTLNVMYVASGTYRQRRIERWDNNSWSVTETDEIDGPFADPNTDSTLSLTPSVRVGNGNLAASRAFFKPGHVGSLFRITQSGQFATRTVSGADQWSDPVLVQGVGGSRAVSFTVGSGLSGTVRIQRSIGNTSSWADATTSSSTSGGVAIVTTGSGAAVAFNDGLDNNKVYYRVGVKTGEYTSGSAVVTIFYPFATTQGICRITNYTSSTSVLMEVINNFATATASTNWEEGAWSDLRGWPDAITEFDGRLWTLRSDKFWGSYSGAYESHARDDGASSSIARDVAVGAANEGQWIMGLGRLIIGTEGAEVVVRSNAFDEPLSTTNMTVREMSTYGVGDIQPIKVDTRCLYVDSSGFHLMEVVYNVQMQDYIARPLTTLHRDIGRPLDVEEDAIDPAGPPSISQLTVMRRPDSRVFAVRGDGQLLVKLFDPTENVLGWGRWHSPGASGVIESVAVLPAGNRNQDEVYVVVARTVNGATRRYLEQLGPLFYVSKTKARRVDSHVTYAGAPTTVLTGYGHLIGETVQVWADGYMAGSFVVDGSGHVTLPAAVSNAVGGLAYQGLYKSTKLAFGAKEGTALAQMGRAAKICFILRKAIAGGIEYGQTFLKMDRLKDRAISDNLGSGPALVTMTTEPMTMPGDLIQDPRICVRFSSPFPGWIDGFVDGHELNERVT